MAFTRIKQEKNGSQVDSARAKLNTAIQAAIERKHESPSSSGDESTKADSEIVIKKEPQAVSSTTSVTTSAMKKQPQRTQRKRRRKDDSAIRSSNTFVMKLFDRAVDLSPFSEETPLYPICRAWINNQPHQSADFIAIKEPKEEDDDEEEEEMPHSDLNTDHEKVSQEEPPVKEIHQLPAPTKYARECLKDIRIPSPVPQSEEEFNICSDEAEAPSKETLMNKHMERWRAVRQKWKQAAQANEDRYKESATVLKAIFEKTQCRDEAAAPTAASSSSETWETIPSVT